LRVEWIHPDAARQGVTPEHVRRMVASHSGWLVKLPEAPSGLVWED
jgi:hypothetical protein